MAQTPSSKGLDCKMVGLNSLVFADVLRVGAHLATTTLRYANSLAPRSGERVRERGSFNALVVLSRCALQVGGPVYTLDATNCGCLYHRIMTAYKDATTASMSRWVEFQGRCG
jgi:hypothetical protein